MGGGPYPPSANLNQPMSEYTQKLNYIKFPVRARHMQAIIEEDNE